MAQQITITVDVRDYKAAMAIEDELYKTLSQMKIRFCDRIINSRIEFDGAVVKEKL